MQVGLPRPWIGRGVVQGQLVVHHHCLHTSSSGEHAQPQKGRRAHVVDPLACANDTRKSSQDSGGQSHFMWLVLEALK